MPKAKKEKIPRGWKECVCDDMRRVALSQSSPSKWYCPVHGWQEVPGCYRLSVHG
jgi:hypothetical protein